MLFTGWAHACLCQSTPFTHAQRECLISPSWFSQSQSTTLNVKCSTVHWGGINRSVKYRHAWRCIAAQLFEMRLWAREEKRSKRTRWCTNSWAQFTVSFFKRSRLACEVSWVNCIYCSGKYFHWILLHPHPEGHIECVLSVPSESAIRMCAQISQHKFLIQNLSSRMLSGKTWWPVLLIHHIVFVKLFGNTNQNLFLIIFCVFLLCPPLSSCRLCLLLWRYLAARRCLKMWKTQPALTPLKVASRILYSTREMGQRRQVSKLLILTRQPKQAADPLQSPLRAKINRWCSVAWRTSSSFSLDWSPCILPLVA